MTSPGIHYAENQALQGFDYQTQGRWQGPFFFIQGADTQFGMINDYLNKNPEVSDWSEEIRLTDLAIARANAMNPKPKFFIVCGDLVNEFPDDKKEKREGQEKSVKECFSKIDPEIPLVCVCGNHDVGNAPTKESMDLYRNSFGDDYFSFWVQGIKCIVLNSQFHFDDSNVPDQRAAMDKWLDQELEDLKSRKAQHVVVFQHIALFLETVDEEDQYFNIPTPTRKHWIEKYREAGIKFVFCGHYHRNAGGSTDGLECVVTSAIGAQMGQDKSGFRLVKVLDDAISHKYYALEDVPKTVDLSKPEF